MSISKLGTYHKLLIGTIIPVVGLGVAYLTYVETKKPAVSPLASKSDVKKGIVFEGNRRIGKVRAINQEPGAAMIFRDNEDIGDANLQNGTTGKPND